MNQHSESQSHLRPHSSPQDLPSTDNDLPTYHELAAQQGPNSRFGRWRGWVEKRAAERFAEDTPEKKLARKLKGWGPHVVVERPPGSSNEDVLGGPSTTLNRTRTILSSFPLDDSELVPTYSASDRRDTCFTGISQGLPPSHLRLHTFGSRFLPHSEHPILCLLPICNDSMLLIGHENGLSVLDVFPETVLSELGPREPRRRDIFYGESVFQLKLLEYEQSSAIPKGVVLALVGTDHPEGASDKDSKEAHKVIRMYNLGSLVNVARWASNRTEGEALDLRQASDPSQSHQSSTKRHKPRASRSKLSVDVNDPSQLQAISSAGPPVPSKDNTHPPSQKSFPRRNEGDREAARDEGPLSWVMDYVPLATVGSRLMNQSVHFFELYRPSENSRITAHLAVVTKQNILLYETVRGERAFRFVKEFYIPVPARSATFMYQCQQAPGSSRRSSGPATLSPDWTRPSAGDLASFRPSSLSTSSSKGQLSLFLVFDKKAGIIRISDAAVGEIDIWEEAKRSRRASTHSLTSAAPFRLSMSSFDGHSVPKESKGTWISPAEVTIPSNWLPCQTCTLAPRTATLLFLTRGKYTHILRSPLAMPAGCYPPLTILHWNEQPTRIVPRACLRPFTGEPFLQITALSEVGIEVQEFLLSSIMLIALTERTSLESSHTEVGFRGAGFLCMGGHWTEHEREVNGKAPLQHDGRFGTVDTVHVSEKRLREQGFYVWTQKDYHDWRVVWLGGGVEDGPPPSSP